MRTTNPKLQLNAAGHYLSQHVWVVSLLGMISALAFYYAQILGLGEWLLNPHPMIGPTFDQVRRGALWSGLPTALAPYLISGFGLFIAYALMRLLWVSHPSNHTSAEDQEPQTLEAIFDYEAMTSFYMGVGVFLISACLSMLFIAPFIDGYIRGISSNFSQAFEPTSRAGAVDLLVHFLLALKTFVGVAIPLYLGTETIFRRWHFRRENVFQSLYTVLTKRFSKAVFLGALVLGSLYHLLLKPGLLLYNGESSEFDTAQTAHLVFWFFAVVIEAVLLDSYCRYFKRPKQHIGHPSHRAPSSMETTATTLPNASVTPATASTTVHTKTTVHTPKNTPKT